MLDNTFYEALIYVLEIGVPCGLATGFIVWLVAWVISQIFHFFKAISQ